MLASPLPAHPTCSLPLQACSLPLQACLVSWPLQQHPPKPNPSVKRPQPWQTPTQHPSPHWNFSARPQLPPAHAVLSPLPPTPPAVRSQLVHAPPPVLSQQHSSHHSQPPVVTPMLASPLPAHP